jgi:hypothetical protein
VKGSIRAEDGWVCGITNGSWCTTTERPSRILHRRYVNTDPRKRG